MHLGRPQFRQILEPLHTYLVTRTVINLVNKIVKIYHTRCVIEQTLSRQRLTEAHWKVPERSLLVVLEDFACIYTGPETCIFWTPNGCYTIDTCQDWYGPECRGSTSVHGSSFALHLHGQGNKDWRLRSQRRLHQGRFLHRSICVIP